MTWTKLADGLPRHPKIVGLSDAAFRLHIYALCYASEQLTDGEIAVAALSMLAPGRHRARLVLELVDAQLWLPTDAGWRLSEAPAWGRETAEHVHDAARKRARRCRRFLVERDGEKCARCGAPESLEVGHKTPLSRGGSSDPANLALLCRSCNVDQGTRTWAEWIGA